MKNSGLGKKSWGGEYFCRKKCLKYCFPCFLKEVDLLGKGANYSANSCNINFSARENKSKNNGTSFVEFGHVGEG